MCSLLPFLKAVGDKSQREMEDVILFKGERDNEWFLVCG